MVDFKSSDISLWKQALDCYPARIASLNKPNLASLDEFYRIELPSAIHRRNPKPYITTPELAKLMQWKLSRGKWRPRLLDFVSSLDEELVKSASGKAFESLPDLSKAVSALTVLKGVGPATASAVLAAYAPDVAPFMSDEFNTCIYWWIWWKAMEAALGNSKDYTLKQYLLFADKLQAKAKELNTIGDSFTSSDVERALWSSITQTKLDSRSDTSSRTKTSQGSKRKRKP
ncbi:unnamed protein product [Linum tenue]|uniref:HhH-GPD domain-containing protein n=1 Tax=Linum tenue TaxID=586396 RepID=A0AAV0P166_9ROSI|nr:unnamed protein product [Linum tenue]